MVKKSLLVCLVIFFLYNVVVTFFWYPEIYMPEHQQQNNYITAQKYLYSNDRKIFEGIIVGSSLARRIDRDSLKKVNIYNMCFDGLSIYDGLNAIQIKGEYPKRVFIEINVVDKDADKEMTNMLNNPITNILRANIVAMRDGKQPMRFIAPPLEHRILGFEYALYDWRHKNRSKKKNDIVPAIGEDHLVSADTIKSEEARPVNKAFLDRNIERYHLNSEKVYTYVDQLFYYVSDLQQNGTEVVFFEMPLHPLLLDTERTKTIRNAFLEKFPCEKYLYLDFTDFSEYSTSDGLHLEPKSALKYTNYFLSQAWR